jgi:hypothetical protein
MYTFLLCNLASVRWKLTRYRIYEGTVNVAAGDSSDTNLNINSPIAMLRRLALTCCYI